MGISYYKKAQLRNEERKDGWKTKKNWIHYKLPPKLRASKKTNNDVPESIRSFICLDLLICVYP